MQTRAYTSKAPALFAEILIEPLAAVLSVAQKRHAGMSHLRAYLVRAPGEQAALHKRERTRGFDEPVFRNGGLGSRLGAVFHIDLIFCCVLEQIVLQSAARLLGFSMHGTEIIFFYLPVAYLVV